LGLYELSRRASAEKRQRRQNALDVLRSPSFGAMLGLGTLLLALFVTWVATRSDLCRGIRLRSGGGIPDFARRVLDTPQGGG